MGLRENEKKIIGHMSIRSAIKGKKETVRWHKGEMGSGQVILFLKILFC